MKANTTRQKLLDMIGDKPIVQAEAARQIGVSRQRVHQLKRKLGLCQFMAHPAGSERWVCPDCGGYKNRWAVRCKECWRSRHSVTLICESCNTKFMLKLWKYERRVRNRKLPFFFCSRQCQGKWFGKKYGIQKGERRNSSPRKYDYRLVYATYLAYGQTGAARVLGMPYGSVAAIASRVRHGKVSLEKEE